MFLAAARGLEEARLAQREIPPRRPQTLLGPDAPRAASPLRAAAIQEGVQTVLVAPLVDGHDMHGVVYLAHDRSHRWREVDLEAAEALAGDAAIAVRSARTFGRMAAWAAQLQSIQRLGARLAGISDVREIGNTIATELRQLITYDNARVYRMTGTQLYPVAFQGHGIVYGAETPESLSVEVGEGITGWVARFRVPQLVDDSANDPRGITIPGTEDDSDESMLLAPMVHEGACLGVVVLVKAGLRQFTEDDLRLLVIYASFAAQAMANADATARLREQSAAFERQARAQGELLRITESILTTLDGRAVLEQITERLGSLIQCDNIAIEVVERGTGILRPLTARGVHADHYMVPWEPGETGIATWVVEHNEPVLIADEATDGRVNHFRDTGAIEGSLIVVPLLGPQGAAGVLTLERIGSETPFDQREFDLVKLFAAQVSIALRNAESFQAAEVRARTDDLTGLLNHGTFKDYLAGSVASGEAFGVVMIDLDMFKAINDTHGPPGGRPAAARDRVGDPQRRPRHGRRVPLRRRRVRRAAAAQRCAGPRRDRRPHPGRGRDGGRTGLDMGQGGCGRVGLDRDRVVPDGRRGRRADPARRRPGLLRRQAARPGPGRDRPRGPRAGGRVHAVDPDAGRPAARGRLTMAPRGRHAILAAALVAGLVAGCLPAAVRPTPVPPPTPTPSPSPSPTPTPTPGPPTPTPGPSFTLHRVVRGDTLTRIARKYGTSGRSIAYWNRDEYPSLDPESPRYNPNELQRGWVLKVLPGEQYVPPPDDGETGESPTPTAPDDEFEPEP